MRLFLALEVPQEIREALGRFQRELAGQLRGWRFARSEGFHLTLRFLGEVQEADLTRQNEIWRSVAAKGVPVRVVFRGLGVFPDERSPRVLWVGAVEEPPAGRLRSLAEQFEQAAVRLGFDPENRPFRPHLTLARASGGGRPTLPEIQPGREFGSALFQEVVLFRSILSPAGASYRPLASFPLGGGTRDG